MNSLLVTLNILRRLLREPYVLALLIVLPMVGTLLAGYMFGQNTLVSVGIANVPEGSPLVRMITDTKVFKVQVVTETVIQKMVQEGSIRAGVVLPKIDAAAKGHSLPKARVFCKTQDSRVLELNAIVDAYMSAIVNNKAPKLAAVSVGYTGTERQYSVAIGFLLFFIFMCAGSSMSSILEDRNGKTLMRMFCAPLREFEVALGNLMACVLLGLIQIVVFVVLSQYVLNMDFGVSIQNLLVVLGGFLLTAIGFNLALAGVARSSQALVISNFAFAGILGMLGGCFLPLDMANEMMRKVSNFIPQKWAMEAYNKLAGGAGLGDVQLQLGILLLFGIVLFTFGVKVLKPSTEEL